MATNITARMDLCMLLTFPFKTADHNICFQTLGGNIRWGKAWCTWIFVLLCVFFPGYWCSHASIVAVGGGRVWSCLQPFHGGPAVGAVPWHPNGVQAGGGCSAMLLGHCLWQQHLPECPRLRPARPLPGGGLWEPSEFLSRGKLWLCSSPSGNLIMKSSHFPFWLNLVLLSLLEFDYIRWLSTLYVTYSCSC